MNTALWNVTPLTGTHVGVLAMGLLGFFALALATERHAEHLLGRLPAPRWRLLARTAGGLLLTVSLAWGVTAWGVGVGITLWLGWLSIAALVLVFAFPRWPWQPPQREKPIRQPKDAAVSMAALPASATHGRRIAAALVCITGAVFFTALVRTGTHPLQRTDAIQGTIGPWSFTLAESDQGPPEIMDMDTPMKMYRMRFCSACDAETRHVYLKVNRPRSARATGMGFMGTRWERRVEIPLPSTVSAESELWLTVIGKDGALHQASWRMDQVSPATVAWFEQRRSTHADR